MKQAYGKGRRKSSHYAQFMPDDGGEELGKIEAKPNYGSCVNPHQEESHKSGNNPFVKSKDGQQIEAEDKKYLQVAETSFSQAVRGRS